MEDPVEDVFVGCVNSEFGSFRLFAGVFSDGDFWIERLLAFLAEKQNFPPFELVIQPVLQLLKISDALAERTELARYSASGGFVSGKAQIPQWRKVLICANAVHFSVADLAALDIDLEMLKDFLFSDERKALLQGEELWNSSFERHPLLMVEGGVIVTAPSQIQSAVLRYLIEHITKGLGGWADMFFQSETASLFVNDVRRRLEIEPMNFKPPPWPDNVQPMLPFFGQFDFGKPVIMLTHCTPLSKSAAMFNGFESFSDDGKLGDYLRSCASEFEKIPGFSGGLILICMASVGYNITVGLNQNLPNWHIDVATLPDWLTLTALGDCPAIRLWKLSEHEAVLHNYNVKTVNLSGLVNQYAFWKANGFRLVPKDNDPRSLTLITINSDFGTGLRVDVKRRRDIHCVRSHDGQRWIKLTRHNSRPLFKEDGEIPLYTDINSVANGCLAGCVKQTRTNWWIISPPRQENSELTDICFRLWESVEAWTARVAAVIERDWPNFSVPSIEVQLVLPNLAKWEYGQKKNSFSKIEDLSVSADAGQMRIVLTIPEGFLPTFSTPKNLAESEIVAALLKGAVQLAGGQLGNQKSAELVREIMRNEDARYFHMVQARGIEQMVAAVGPPKPLFIREEDSSLVQQGLADLVGRPQSGNEIVGLENCKTYLKNTVTKVWERIETRLKPFNREFAVLRCFQALDEIARDEKQWDMTARSQFALHKDKENVHDVLLDRRSDRAKATLCNRLIIETAQYACPLTDGRMFTEADHLTILADMALLILLANHRDAIAYGFIDAKIDVLPNGELEVDEKFYANVFSKYLTKRSRAASDEAAADYETYFPWIEQSKDETTVGDENALNEFDKVFAPEFGFSIHLLFRALDEFRTMAVKTDQPGGKVTEDVMQLFLRVSGFKPHEAEAFLDCFTLPIRSAWDCDLPPRCRDYDVFPWRFRRQLSLNVRPLVQVSLSPRAWVVSVPVFEKSITYVLGHLRACTFSTRFFPFQSDATACWQCDKQTRS